ncbi:hypothetical protein VNO77_46281 [Canavalia gladiata]|uniref:Uncharacterized protein n=1 Tax=Canavalia gladiata TaxID=3824 RepID=A0AAN9JHJ5_CANGL
MKKRVRSVELSIAKNLSFRELEFKSIAPGITGYTGLAGGLRAFGNFNGKTVRSNVCIEKGTEGSQRADRLVEPSFLARGVRLIEGLAGSYSYRVIRIALYLSKLIALSRKLGASLPSLRKSSKQGCQRVRKRKGCDARTLRDLLKSAITLKADRTKPFIPLAAVMSQTTGNRLSSYDHTFSCKHSTGWKVNSFSSSSGPDPSMSDAQSAPPELERVFERICDEYAEWVVIADKQLPPEWNMPDLVRTVIGDEAIHIPGFLTDWIHIMIDGYSFKSSGSTIRSSTRWKFSYSSISTDASDTGANANQVAQEKEKLHSLIYHQFRHFYTRGRPKWQLSVPSERRNQLDWKCAETILSSLEIPENRSEYQEWQTILSTNPSTLYPQNGEYV